MTRLLITRDDITGLNVDAIVNAANESLLGGGGVDGAIHRAAGPKLLEACRLLNGCRVGEAKITPGFMLPAAAVIHTVGPKWRGGQQNEAKELESCYHSSLVVAHREGRSSLAFPAISCGAFGFPIEEAALIAVKAVSTFPELNFFKSIQFCAFTDEIAEALARAFKKFGIPLPANGPMNLIEEWSPNRLRKEINERVSCDDRPLMASAKVFSAVADIQGYNGLPLLLEKVQLDEEVSHGATEMNRGISSLAGIPVEVFVREFVQGMMYPGAQIAVGHGIYFAQPTLETGQTDKSFGASFSEMAKHHAAQGEGGGAIIRAALRVDAKVITREDIRDYFREHKNRAERAGISDLGTFCAAAGYDAIVVEDLHHWTKEISWNVVNRSALMTQAISLQVSPKN